MKNRKMVVVDLDGTLLNIRSGLSRDTKRYLKKLKESGCVIVIATGRILKDAYCLTDGAEFADYIICNSGGLIYDMKQKKIIAKNDISKEDAKRILNLYNDELNYITICDLFYYNRYSFNGKIDLFFDREIKDFNKFIDNCDNIMHIIVEVKDIKLIKKYYNLFVNDNVSVLVMQDSFSDLKYIEIYGKNVSKYNAIKIIREIENINNDNIIAFGDGRNDIDMIKNCGVGVAMGNALSDVKNVSDYVTISHNKDGVMHFLKEYLN